MNKNFKKNMLIVTIIICVAIVFVPIYIFVLADANDDNKFTISNKKIVGMVDGTSSFDYDDNVGNDSSESNNRVRTFDSIKYTVEYTLTEKVSGSTSGNVEGRNLLVEVLIPDTYEAILRYGDQVTTNMDERTNASKKTFNGVGYYYSSFSVPVSTLGTASTFDFVLSNINSVDINTYNSIKPLIFIKESTDADTLSIADSNSLPSDIACALTTNQASSSVCDVTITGVENYFVNMYSGNKETESRDIPIGLLIGLPNQGEKGIKGLIIPSTINLTISNSDSSKLTFKEVPIDAYRTYQSNTDPRINIDEYNTELPEINNGEITGTISDGEFNITISNIKDYLINPLYRNSNLDFYYFSTNYFKATLATRDVNDYSDIRVNLSCNSNDSNNNITTLQVFDPFNYVLGNYSSNIDIYGSGLISDDTDVLTYGQANLNYGSDFKIKTNFDYSSLTNSTANGMISLTNYIKIDNDAFRLINDKDSNKGYNFIAGELVSVPTIKLDTETVDGNTHEKVYFGFGDWDSNYFDIAPNAPSYCPSSISSLSKDQLMNLYGGPCIVEKPTLAWAYSPVAEHDINGNVISYPNGAIIVKSTYVSNNGQYIEPGYSGTIELYGTIYPDYELAETTHQIVTSATAYGRNDTDYRYLGNESLDGSAILANPNNFVKTKYDFANRNLISNNTNTCSNYKCPVSGNSILISAIKSTKPVLESHYARDLSKTESQFYYYPFALTVNANASRNDDNLRYDTIYVDIYLPSYMYLEENYGIDNEKVPYSIGTTTLSSIYSSLGKGVPAADENYNVYHFILTAESSSLNETEIENLQQGILSGFTVYTSIDLISTPSVVTPEIYATVDFKATRYTNRNGETIIARSFNSITPLSTRYDELTNITLHNSTAVITKSTTIPKYIEKNGTYSFNMLAYNGSDNAVENGYVYPTADLYYVLPYNGDLASDEISSKIGTTKFTVYFDSNSLNAISNINDYKFYYMTKGTPSNIISDEINVTSDPSADWVLWEEPTVGVSNVIAVKVVKQSPFGVNEYFGSSAGLTINVEAVNSSDGNVFYNSFHLLTTKPSNFTCDSTSTEADYDYCSEMMQTKINYTSSSAVTSVYAREISGFVFEDYDYNGIYTSDENKLNDIPVSLYKLSEIPEDYDPINPSSFVGEDDQLVASTVTGENGNYYFGGLASGNYYVSFTINNQKYIVTDLERINDNIPNSINNNSRASILSNTNKAVSGIITFPEQATTGNITISNMNLGLAIKKEMAIELNKYITEVVVTRNGRVNTYDYSNQNATQVSINVINPKGTTVRVKYSFSIENVKYFPGYVGMIVDSMPEGMTFDPNIKENQYWVMYDNLLYYNGLAGKLLLPNEKQYFTLILDLDLKEAGTYRNIVSAKDVTLKGEELPVYDFSTIINSVDNNETNNTEGAIQYDIPGGIQYDDTSRDIQYDNTEGGVQYGE